ncbi:transcription factor S-II-domain-containing protein [Catenaria anguillulae PL171]|uniref:DNA-directed RNA polymerase subunit n=1 Tax=Catenaria anguillulae PL171 TaxID=765915 RepID=A0A1Y2HY04_9FUNG|nr:transcription factor S-II-domain-containing protein [Catenaria anguillulae PL171]
MSHQPDNVSGLVFCPTCGNLLDMGTSALSDVKCSLCTRLMPASAFEGVEVVTRSRPNAFATANREISLWKSQMGVGAEQGATINEKCPKCGNPEMTFHTMQLRSADEGQTVFYSCKKCGHKFSLNS